MERILDVSDLEAPEPLLRAVAALESLPSGDYLRFRHRMNPTHLYEVMRRKGLAWVTRHGEEVECELFIWREGDVTAEQDAREVAKTLLPWEE